MKYLLKSYIPLMVFILLIISAGCKSEQEKLNEQYRVKLASLKLNMSESHVAEILGESKYHLQDQPDTPYVQVYFYPSPDSAISMAKCYFNKYTRLAKVEWNDSVYLDIRRGGPVQPSGRFHH
jgi:hypothetical protein